MLRSSFSPVRLGAHGRQQRKSAGSRQVDAWRHLVAPLWEISVEENEDRFTSSSAVYHLGTCILGNTSATAHRIERSQSLIARMGVDHVLVQLRHSGRAHMQADKRELVLAPGDIGLFDMSRSFSGRSSDYRAVTLALPRSLLAPTLRDPDDLHGTVIRARSPLGALAADYLSALGTHAGRLSPQEGCAAVEGMAALIVAAARGGLPMPQAGEDMAQPAIIVLRRYIEANLASPRLSAESLAQRFGLSRSALYRLFAPVDGVATYIRRRRLARAHRDLAFSTTQRHLRVQEVAFRWGFENPAHFVQAFRQEFGCTPREVRAGALAHVPPSAMLTPGRDASLFDWVMKLTA